MISPLIVFPEEVIFNPTLAAVLIPLILISSTAGEPAVAGEAPLWV